MRFSIIGFLFVCIWCVSLKGVTVGSNTASSRQLKTFFPAIDNNNLMCGFAVFEKGLTLEDSTTTCSFDAFFPVSGDVVLNGGILRLLRDIELKNPFALGPETIDGRLEHALEFPGNVSGISVPSENHTKILSLVDSDDAVYDVNSVDWSYDGQYLAIGTTVGTSHDEIKIYYFDGMTLTVTASQDVGYGVPTVRWHPSNYYLAVGNSGSTELEFYYLNVGNGGTLQQTDTVNLANVSAVAWSPTGEYLAVGEITESNLRVFEVIDGVSDSMYSVSISSGVDRTVRNNAL